MTFHTPPNRYFKIPIVAWVLFSLAVLSLLPTFYHGLSQMYESWIDVPEYGHGIFLPFLTAFLIYTQRDALEKAQFKGSWIGFLLLLLGLFFALVGSLSTYVFLVQYGCVLVVTGLILSYTGLAVLPQLFIAIVILFLMVPLPQFIFLSLSSHLQLISSQLGVLVIELFQIPVYLEGNVIDLGAMRLQVVEACSGLRYLFPLMSVGFICAAFFNAPLWQRVVVFLATIPITVFMNSFRIGVIGVTVEYWGKGMAEGFLHDFEGWVIFMSAFALLLFLMWMLNRFGRNLSWQSAFVIEMPSARDEGAEADVRKTPLSFYAAVLVCFSAFAYSQFKPERIYIEPSRESFHTFPVFIDDWVGSNQALAPNILEELQLDDYIMADYINSQKERINFYAAYYASQHHRSFVHSPERCLPGGGWQIVSNEVVDLPNISQDGPLLKVNRTVIQRGKQKRLVYYWFKQRDRILTNDKQIKLYLFVDSVQKNRSDGSLLRVITEIGNQESDTDADQRLQVFLDLIYPNINRFIPD